MRVIVVSGGCSARGGPARAPQLVSVPNSTRTGRSPLVRRARARSLPCGAGVVSDLAAAATGGSDGAASPSLLAEGRGVQIPGGSPHGGMSTSTSRTEYRCDLQRSNSPRLPICTH